MTRITNLFRTPAVHIDRSDHPQDLVPLDGAINRLTEYAVTYVVSGEFRVRRNCGSWDFHPGDALLNYPGVQQAVFHPQAGAHDVCLWLSFHRTSLENILGKLPAIECTPRRPASGATAFNLWRLHEGLQSKDRLTIESVALSAARLFLPDYSNDHAWRAVDRSFAWYKLRIRRACDYIGEYFASDCSLFELAGISGMSPFHFSRVFHYLVGVPVHQYVANRRLAEAARLLREGRSVTETAFDVGFSSVSYFSRAFHRHFGQAPRCFRKLCMNDRLPQ